MKNRNVIIGLTIVGILIVLCCSTIACGVIVYGFTSQSDLSSSNGEEVFVTIVPPSEKTSIPAVPAATVSVDIIEEENIEEENIEVSEEMEHETVNTLKNEEVPINDPIELAERLGGKEDVPATKPVEDLNREVGERETFWVTNVDTTENFQVDTILEAVTDHLYIWIEDGVKFSKRDLDKLAQTFETKIYPTDREFFGSEWSPGVDNDPHIYIIYASGLGSNLAGYFSSVDEYHPLAHEYSNSHETFMLNADTCGLDESYTYGVLAHEFQHMIHWYWDRNETSWLNEGFSELAAFLNGYYNGGFARLYAQNPDLQLNDWPNDPSKTTPHYGSGFLFVAYFLDRFGSDATQALVSHELNGMSSIDALNLTDPDSGESFGADDIFIDWAITNYLQSEYSLTGRYNYNDYDNAPYFSATETISECPTSEQERTVHQYGVDYIHLTCPGDYVLRFDGEEEVGVIPANPHSGNFAYWSNKGDHSDMTLDKTFDFTAQDAPLTLTYWTWYDLEEDYDYLYLEASTDGENWEIIHTPSGTDEDPSGNSYGWGYNGSSGGDGSWIQEKVDLSQFAGQKVQIRFEYVTDAAVNGEGLLLDDIAIPETGYSTDFEVDAGGWDGAGFVRIQNVLPQTYRLAILKLGDSPEIEYLTLTAGNEIEIPLTIGNGNPSEILLVVTATTRFTRQEAAYSFWVEQP
ncbi:MAG: immune inhibitor A [Chloroflexota bacterium]|nr:immune inhibitor A [Chloroflexota bacterium]